LAIDAQVLDQVARKAPGFRGRTVCVSGQLTHLASGDWRSVIVGALPVAGAQFGQQPSANASAPLLFGAQSGMGMGGKFVIPVDQPATPAAGGKLPTPPPGSQAGQQPAVVVSPPPIIAAQTAYQPVIDVPNVGIVVGALPVIAPGADTAVLDVQGFVTRWGKPSPPAKLGSAGSASCPVDRINMPAAELAMTARVPLGKPVLLGAVTFAPGGGAGLDKATDTPVQLCLIATTSIAADAKKPAKK